MIYDVLKTFDIPKLDKGMCFAGIDYIRRYRQWPSPLILIILNNSS